MECLTIVKPYIIVEKPDGKGITRYAKSSQRNKPERLAKFKMIFLNYFRKMNSSGEMVPWNGSFKKDVAIVEFKNLFADLKLNKMRQKNLY